MRIAVFSDSHTFHRRIQLPEADVLVCCGDITGKGEVETVTDFIDWIRDLPYRHKLLVPGNHDHCFDIRKTGFVQGLHAALEDAGVVFCIDRRVELDGVVFYGSPWVPNLPGWAFYDKGEDRFSDIPRDTQVLVTHSPPKGILDQGDYHNGSIHLLRAVRSLPRLKVHLFGHVHEGYGELREEGEPHFVNACVCTRNPCLPTNAPILVEFEP